MGGNKQSKINETIAKRRSDSNTKQMFDEFAESFDNFNYNFSGSNTFNWKSSVVSLDPSSSNYEIVKRVALLPYEIKNIEKVNNDWIYLKYVSQRCCFAMKYSSEQPEEKIVFYGTQRSPYEICLDDVGFDFRKISYDYPNGFRLSWGNGLHFSEDVMHAHLNCFRNPIEPNICKVIMAKMIVGNCVELDVPDETLRVPPLVEPDLNNDSLFERYDTVTGIVNNRQRVFVAYENCFAIPSYVITYDESVIVKDFSNYVRWSWKDEIRFLRSFPKESNSEIEYYYRAGAVFFTSELKLSNEEKSVVHNVCLSDDNFSIINTEKNEETDIVRMVYKHGVNFSNLLVNSLKQDLKIITEKLESSKFLTSSIKKMLLEDIKEQVLMIESKTPLISVNELQPNNPNFQRIQNEFRKTLKNGTIVSILEIDNKLVKTKYIIQKIITALKSHCVNEKLLFHGTRTTSPEVIYKDLVGFDMRYSNEGYWGKANYFAEFAIYSNDYAHVLNDGLRQIFMAKVIIGNVVRLNPDVNLVEPPIISIEKRTNDPEYVQKYDSVCGISNDTDVFMIYENNRAIPNYLITYKLNDI